MLKGLSTVSSLKLLMVAFRGLSPWSSLCILPSFSNFLIKSLMADCIFSRAPSKTFCIIPSIFDARVIKTNSLFRSQQLDSYFIYFHWTLRTNIWAVLPHSVAEWRTVITLIGFSSRWRKCWLIFTSTVYRGTRNSHWEIPESGKYIQVFPTRRHPGEVVFYSVYHRICRVRVKFPLTG